jgi:hypothetical protein
MATKKAAPALKSNVVAFILAKSKKVVYLNANLVSSVEAGATKGTSTIVSNGETLTVAGGPAASMMKLGWMA